ncbi:MAG TPA: hypothetical protein VNA87_00505 [Actinomycetota bacterium]|nr:hypothetical protein [Actinomycetota bacterium]
MPKRKKVLGLAALGAIVAWLMGRRKRSAPPEGQWRSAASFDEEGTR